MANLGRGIRGGLAGAGLGAGLTATGIGAPLGIPLTLLGGIGGFLTGAFSESEEDIRRRRINELLTSLETNRKTRLSEGVKQIGTYTAGLKKNAEAKAARTALASGREGTAQSLALPMTGQVARAGTKAVGDFTTATNRQYDAMRYDIQRDQASEPIEPGALDYLELAGEAGMKFSALKNIQGADEQRLKTDEANAASFINPASGEREFAPVLEEYKGPGGPKAQEGNLDWMMNLRKQGRGLPSLERPSYAKRRQGLLGE